MESPRNINPSLLWAVLAAASAFCALISFSSIMSGGLSVRAAISFGLEVVLFVVSTKKFSSK